MLLQLAEVMFLFLLESLLLFSVRVFKIWKGSSLFFFAVSSSQSTGMCFSFM